MVDADIHLLDRGTIRTDSNHIIEGHITASADNPHPDVALVDGPVYNLLIDHPEGTILWDTGSHPEAGDGHWPDELYAAFEHADADERDLDTALGEVGYAVDDIDYVVQSHLHLDHAGGLYRFADTDVPVFVHEAELKYAYYSAKTDAGSTAYLADDFDHNLNWEIVHRDGETHFEDIEFLHLPGHTPGLLGLSIDLDDEGRVLIAGDEFYTRTNFEDEQPLGAGLLWSKRDWYDSLRKIQERQRRHDARVFCGHDPVDVATLRDEFA